MATNLRFELATDASEYRMRKLLRENPLSGSIELALEREPNAFHAAGISGDTCQLILAYEDDDNDIVGAGARFEFDAWVNGTTRRIGYLGELRSKVGFSYRRSLLLEAYRALRLHHMNGSVPWYLTTIVADNSAARRLLEAGLSDMPTYEPKEMMATLTIPAKSGASTSAGSRDIRSAHADDVEPIADALARYGRGHQFNPHWTAAVLQSTSRCRGLTPADFLICQDKAGIQGVLALWDQRQFKQTVIRGYSAKLGRLRPFFNVVAPVVRRPRLPAPGASLQSAFLSHVAVEADDADTLVALIRRACREAVTRGLDYVMLGIAERHPLCSVVRDRFSCHSYLSMIYVVYWSDGSEEAAKIDSRIPHPEMAIL